MDLVDFRALVTMGLGGFLFFGCLSDTWRGVTIFGIWRADAPWRFWLLVLAQLIVFGAILFYGAAQYLIATGQMPPLGFAGL